MPAHLDTTHRQVYKKQLGACTLYVMFSGIWGVGMDVMEIIAFTLSISLKIYALGIIYLSSFFYCLCVGAIFLLFCDDIHTTRETVDESDRESGGEKITKSTYRRQFSVRFFLCLFVCVDFSVSESLVIRCCCCSRRILVFQNSCSQPAELRYVYYG